MARVSVITAAYNHAPYVRQCVASVLAQTYKDMEYIVVDDGSTDGTADVLRGYGDAIIYIRQENRGTQAARNRAIHAAKGQFIALLDSDDAWLPRKLERQMAVFEQNPEVGLVYSFAHVMDSSGKISGASLPIGIPITPHPGAWDQLVVENCIPAPTAVFRRSCLDALFFFDETLIGAADWDLWLRIAYRWQVACVPEPLALYRVHNSNTTMDLLKTKLAVVERMKVLERAFGLLTHQSEEYGTKVKALARLHLLSGDCEAYVGNAEAVGGELAEALRLDPSLACEPVTLSTRMVDWTQSYVRDDKSWKRHVGFVDQVFSQAQSVCPSIMGLKRTVLSNATMSAVFSLFDSKDFVTLRPLLCVAIGANPRWLGNHGIWSIAVESLVGQRVAAWLRTLARKCFRK